MGNLIQLHQGELPGHHGDCQLDFDQAGLLDVVFPHGGIDSLDTKSVKFIVHWSDPHDDPDHNQNHLPVFIMRVAVKIPELAEDDDPVVAEAGDTVEIGAVLGIKELTQIRDLLSQLIDKCQK